MRGEGKEVGNEREQENPTNTLPLFSQFNTYRVVMKEELFGYTSFTISNQFGPSWPLSLTPLLPKCDMFYLCCLMWPTFQQ